MARSTCWKLFCTTLGILEAAIYSATLFGWPAFMYIFIEEGFYVSHCQFDSGDSASINSSNQACVVFGNCSLLHKCTEQEEMLNLVYTVAMFGLMVLLVLGYIYDHCGTVCVRILCIFLCAGGFSLMALADKGTEWLLFPGALFHLLGGFQLGVTDVQVAILFPKARTTLTCLVSGAIDVSSFAPILLKVAYQAGVPYKTCMFTFAGIILLMSSVNTFTLPPRQDDEGNNIDIDCCFKIRKRHISLTAPNTKGSSNGNGTIDKNTVIESSTDKQLGNINSDDEVNGGKTDEIIDQHNKTNGTCSELPTTVNLSVTCVDRSPQSVHEEEANVSKDGAKSTKSLRQGTLLILKSPTFWMLLLWLICLDTIIVTYQGCFYAIINYLGNNDKSIVSTYTDVYSWFQVSSLFWALFTGVMLDRLVARATSQDATQCFVVPFFLTILPGVIVSVACITPIIEMQAVAILFYSLLKTGSFAVHMAFVVSAFPKEHFGKAYGIQVTVSSLLTFIELPIFSWYKNSLESDPLLLGVLFLGICFTASCLPFYLLWRRCCSTRSHSYTI